MKSLIISALLIAIVAAQFRGHTPGHSGQPACTDPTETHGSVWRHNFDPTKYWECVKENEPAEARACKSEFMFQPAKNVCVWREEWIWTPLEDPLSLA